MPKHARTARQAQRLRTHMFRLPITPLAQREIITLVEIADAVLVQDFAGAALGDGVGERAEIEVGPVVDAYGRGR